MSNLSPEYPTRQESCGQGHLSLVDRVGVYLSKRAIVRHLPGNSNLVALDIGCGYHATHLRMLYPCLARGLGIDVKIAEDVKHMPRLSFIQRSVEEALPSLASASFDLILLISVLEHLWEPLLALRECHRILKPKGILLVNVPTWRGKYLLELSAFRLKTSPACEMDDHKMYYDKRDLWPILVRAGFKPSNLKLQYHKFGLNLFAVAMKWYSGVAE